MKNLNSTVVATLFVVSLWAQSPEKMSYQAVLRNSSNELLIEQTVGLQISILQGSAGGSVAYLETHTISTNANGLLSVEIGTGSSSDNFAAIDWSNGPYYLKTETDPNGGSNYTIVGTSQLLSVPYALYAKTAENITESDPVFEESAAYGITTTDTSNWNNKIDSESQTVADVAALGNSVNTQLKHLSDPTDPQDAATKAYVDGLQSQINALADMLLDAGLYPLTDIEGNTYLTVRIGEQVWMKENLKTSTYNDGTEIPFVSNASLWWERTTPAYCWSSNAQRYGALYNWYAVETGKLCPTGWHVPSNTEWTTLESYLGGNTIAGGKLKEAGTIHWQDPNTGATNESNFTALPAGYLESFGEAVISSEYYGYWWTSTAAESTPLPTSVRRSMQYNSAVVATANYVRYDGYSVRCIQD